MNYTHVVSTLYRATRKPRTPAIPAAAPPMVVGRAKPPLVVEKAVVEAVSLEPLVKLSVEAALVRLVDWVKVAWSTVPERVI